MGSLGRSGKGDEEAMLPSVSDQLAIMELYLGWMRSGLRVNGSGLKAGKSQEPL